MKPNEQQLREKARRQLDQFLEDCQIDDPAGLRILEIGFKNGLFMDECRKRGMIPVGTEVLQHFYDEVTQKLPEMELVMYKGGPIELPDASFDAIVSFQVVEHVETPEGISLDFFFHDLSRLLKPGGVMYHRCPNYRSFYEGHYNVIWWPWLNRQSGRRYLRMLGKPLKEYDETIGIVKPQRLREIFAEIPGVELETLGQDQFLRSCTADQIELVGHKGLRSLLKGMTALRVHRPLLKSLAWMDCHYPLIIIARKPSA